MLQNAQQERVRGNKALFLIEAIGVVEELLFVVHLWVLCHQLPFFPLLGSFQTRVLAPGQRKRPHPSPHRSRPYAIWIPSEVVLAFQYHKVVKI